MIRRIECTINGKPAAFDADPRKSLAETLRELGYTGVKIGCEVGECGACTVIIDGRTVDSCLFLSVWAEGKDIRTIEGETREGRLSAVQQAYIDEGAVQCGFCTPGFVMASTAFVEKHKGEPCGAGDIRKGLAGNLCRCTGYTSILRAAEKCLKEEE